MNYLKNYFARFLMIFFMIGIISVNDIFAQSAKKKEKERPTVGVVLCGGGAKGFGLIRILKAIDEAGIPVDYIAGTSIGSIIGSLYAVGYDPDEIEKMVRAQDWNAVIYDQIPQKYLPIEKKVDTRRYLASFPISNGKIKVKSSVVDGVYVNMLLSRLMLPAHNIRDYNKLPVPFFCIATDVEHACQYEMTKGDLARSVRASMSIPFLFKPVRLDNKLLIDGGMINNFPVRNMKERGADIIIGIDLEDATIPASEIDNSLLLLTSLMNLSSLEESLYARSNCDIYIRPDMHGRNMLSFDDYDSIIYFGQVAADQFMPKFKRLADSLQMIEYFEIERPHTKPMETIKVVGVKVEGIEDSHNVVVAQEFGTIFPQEMTITDIEDAILRLRATGYYENFWYGIEDAKGGYILKVHCEEISDRTAAVAIHYDNDYGIGALVNFTIKNVVHSIDRSTLRFDLNIAENPYFKVTFDRHHRKVFRFGADFGVYSLTMNQYHKGTLTNSYSIQANKLDLHAKLVPNLRSLIKIGAVADLIHMNDVVGDGGLKDNYNLFSYLYLNFYYENLDAPSFARKGWRIDMTAKMIFYQGVTDEVTMVNMSNSGMQSSFVAYIDMLKTIPIGKKSALIFELEGATRLGDAELPVFYHYFVGGQSKMKYFDNIISFSGLAFTESVVEHLAFNKIAWQWNFYGSLYSTLHFDYGFMHETYDKWFDSGSFVLGCGASLGINTLLGPVEVSVMGSNCNSGVMGFINVGYWF